MNLNFSYKKFGGIALGLVIAGWIAYYSFAPRGPIVEFSYQRDSKEVLKIFYDDWDWLFPGPHSDYSPEFIIKYRSPGDEPYYKKYMGKLKIKVLRDSGRVAGFTTFYKKNFYEGRILFVAVSRDFRRKGYGRMLTKYAIGQLFKMGCRKVSLVTRTFNKRARSLYSSLGFHMDIEDDGAQFTHFSITPEAFAQKEAELNKKPIPSPAVS